MKSAPILNEMEKKLSIQTDLQKNKKVKKAPIIGEFLKKSFNNSMSNILDTTLKSAHTLPSKRSSECVRLNKLPISARQPSRLSHPEKPLLIYQPNVTTASRQNISSNTFFYTPLNDSLTTKQSKKDTEQKEFSELLIYGILHYTPPFHPTIDHCSPRQQHVKQNDNLKNKNNLKCPAEFISQLKIEDGVILQPPDPPIPHKEDTKTNFAASQSIIEARQSLNKSSQDTKLVNSLTNEKLPTKNMACISVIKRLDLEENQITKHSDFVPRLRRSVIVQNSASNKTEQFMVKLE
eukprot:GFUD01127526.1.p1 GENE.GFUD01127526.1~~GFUD01127526.1.p1  ORF type:complete len:293 (+),score=60.95 GFUD01127526.1:225-1103(+)